MHTELSCCLSRVNKSLSTPTTDDRVHFHIRADASHTDTTHPRLHISCLYDGRYWLQRLPLILERGGENYVLGLPRAPLLVTADGGVSLTHDSKVLSAEGVCMQEPPFNLTAHIGTCTYVLEFSSDNPNLYVSKFKQSFEHVQERLQLYGVCRKITQNIQANPQSERDKAPGASVSLKHLLTTSRNLDECLCDLHTLSRVRLCSSKDLLQFDEPGVFKQQCSYYITPLLSPLQAPQLYDLQQQLRTARQNFRVETMDQGLALASVLFSLQKDAVAFKRGMQALANLRNYAVNAINSNKQSVKRNVVFSRMMYLLLRAVDNAFQCYSSAISNRQKIPHFHTRRHRLFRYELSHLVDQRNNETLFVSPTVANNIHSHLADIHELILAAPSGNGRLGVVCTRIFMDGIFDCVSENCKFRVMDKLCTPYVYRRKLTELPTQPPIEDACELAREHFSIFCDIILFAHENYALSKPVFQLFCRHLSESPSSFDATRHQLLLSILKPPLHPLFEVAMGRAKPDFGVTCSFLEESQYIPTFDCSMQAKATLDIIMPDTIKHASAPTGTPTIKQTPKTPSRPETKPVSC